MLFLKDEMPLDVMKTEGKMLSYVGKSMEKLMNGLLPVSNDALNKTFARIELKLTNRTATNNSEERRVWQWVKLIQSTFDDEIKQNLTNMMKKIQGIKIMGKSMPRMSGSLGDGPTADDLCLAYSSFIQYQQRASAGGAKDKLRAKIEMPPTVWNKKGQGIFKVELCPLSGEWFWSKVAACACKDSFDMHHNGDA